MSTKGQKVSEFEEVRERVFELIQSHNLLNEENILVDMEGSEIILYGDVSSEDKKWLAEDISLNLPGVYHISNRIQVVEH